MLFSVIGIALVGVSLCLVVQQYRPEFSMMTALICGILVFGIIVVNLEPALDSLSNLISGIDANNEYVAVVLKALGICYLTQLASDTCKDSGYSAIASKVELAGKVSILLISLPLFNNLVELALSLISLGR